MGQIPPHSWPLPPLKADSREALPPPREREMGCATGRPQWFLRPIPSPLWHPDLLCGHCLGHPCQLPPALPGPGPSSFPHPAWEMSPLAFSFTQYHPPPKKKGESGQSALVQAPEDWLAGTLHWQRCPPLLVDGNGIELPRFKGVGTQGCRTISVQLASFFYLASGSLRCSGN